MKIIDALRNGLGHYKTEDALYRECKLYSLDPNGDVEPGTRIKLGPISIMAFDTNNIPKRIKEVPPEEIECPTCNGTGKILSDLN